MNIKQAHSENSFSLCGLYKTSYIHSFNLFPILGTILVLLVFRIQFQWWTFQNCIEYWKVPNTLLCSMQSWTIIVDSHKFETCSMEFSSWAFGWFWGNWSSHSCNHSSTLYDIWRLISNQIKYCSAEIRSNQKHVKNPIFGKLLRDLKHEKCFRSSPYDGSAWNQIIQIQMEVYEIRFQLFA